MSAFFESYLVKNHFFSANASIYPNNRFLWSRSNLSYISRRRFSSDASAIILHFCFLLLQPSSSTPDNNSYGVTFNSSQIIRILSDAGFVFFFLQSLIVLYGIPVFSEKSFWDSFSSSNSLKIFWLIVILCGPLLMMLNQLFAYSVLRITSLSL